MPALRDDETLDDLLHGEMKLIQRRAGYRYSADALLLASFALPLVPAARVLDLGTGSGVVALIIARRGRPARVVGVEIQPGLAGIARRNTALNATDPPVEILEADGLALAGLDAAFDLVVSNPPFHPGGSGPVNPDTERALARHELAMTIDAWLLACRRALRTDAPPDRAPAACIVYPAEQEARLLAAATAAGLYPRRAQAALDRPGTAPRLVLYEFRPDPGPLDRLPDVPIQTDAGKFSLDGYK